MIHMIYYYFLHDVIKNIEAKYQNLLDDTIDKVYLYSNLIEIIAYYDLLKSHQKYPIYQKMKKEKGKETLDFLKYEVIHNQYDNNYLLFLIACVSHKILDNYLTAFTNNKIDQLAYLEHYLYHQKTQKTYHKFNQITFFKTSLTLTNKDEEIISKLFSQVFYFSIGINYFKISLKKFKKIKQQYLKDCLGFKRFYLFIMSKIKRDNRIKYLNYKPKNINDYLNEKHQPWFYLGSIEKKLNFQEMYQEAIIESSKIVNMICDEIYYNKPIKKSLAPFF